MRSRRRAWGVVILGKVGVDGHLQIDDGMEDAASVAFSRDFGEEALD